MDVLLRWGIAGAVLITALSFLWHFLSGLFPCRLTALISPVNESPWEHAKLFFLPALLFFFVEYAFIGHKYPNYLFAHAIALSIMPLFMLGLYSVYSSFVNETFLLDILNSVLTVLVGLLLAYRLTVSTDNLATTCHRVWAFLILIAQAALYALFTFRPPKCGLFQDPVTLRYGA